MVSTNFTSRMILSDTPIVEMLLIDKFSKSGIMFEKTDCKSDLCGTGITCYVSGSKKSLYIKRNSSRYFNSLNFLVTLNKNNLSVFNNALYVFIDEVANCLYLVEGVSLLTYIINNSHKVCVSDKLNNSYYIIIPKVDIMSLTGNNDNVIKYNEGISNLLALNRDECLFNNLL
jgi:hypothetical protein